MPASTLLNLLAWPNSHSLLPMGEVPPHPPPRGAPGDVLVRAKGRRFQGLTEAGVLKLEVCHALRIEGSAVSRGLAFAGWVEQFRLSKNVHAIVRLREVHERS